MQGEHGVGVPVKVLVDSQPALDIVHNPVYHARTKQILARYHFVRDRVFQEKELYIIKINAGQMGADMMTKHTSVGIVHYNKKRIDVGFYYEGGSISSRDALFFEFFSIFRHVFPLVIFGFNFVTISIRGVC